MINLIIFNKIKFNEIRECITFNSDNVCSKIWHMTNDDDNIIHDGIFWGEDEPQLINSAYEIARRNIVRYLQFFHIDIVFNIKCGNMKYITKLTKQNILKAFK